MRALIFLLGLSYFCDARPSVVGGRGVRAFFNPGQPRIVGGVEAMPGEFPWQLSMEREGAGGVWGHFCGASLLTHTYALTAAHCVDGATALILRVWGGLHDLTDTSAGNMSPLGSFKMHEYYGIAGQGTYANDLAILTLQTPMNANGGNIDYLVLPADNSNNFAGTTCTISGWGRTSSSDELSTVLRKADGGIITTEECNQLVSPVPGVSVTDNHICLYDTAQQTASCNGDSGGPLNCEGATVVAGIASWVISSAGDCQPTYPSVYTRTSAYLDWIATNTP